MFSCVRDMDGRMDTGAGIEDVQSNDTIPRLCHFHQRPRQQLPASRIQLHPDNHYRTTTCPVVTVFYGGGGGRGGATFLDSSTFNQSHFRTNGSRKRHNLVWISHSSVLSWCIRILMGWFYSFSLSIIEFILRCVALCIEVRNWGIFNKRIIIRCLFGLRCSHERQILAVAYLGNYY